MIRYLHLDQPGPALGRVLRAAWKRTACWWSGPRLGHDWQPGSRSWSRKRCRACGVEQRPVICPGE